MTKPVRVMLIAAGSVAALFIGVTGCDRKPASAGQTPQKQAFYMYQVPGDPPITIGDGSLHVACPEPLDHQLRPGHGHSALWNQQHDSDIADRLY